MSRDRTTVTSPIRGLTVGSNTPVAYRVGKVSQHDNLVDVERATGYRGAPNSSTGFNAQSGEIHPPPALVERA